MAQHTLQEWEALLTSVTSGDFSIHPREEEEFDVDREEGLNIVADYRDNGTGFTSVAVVGFQEDQTLPNAQLLAASKESVSELVRVLRFMNELADEINEESPEVAEKIRRNMVNAQPQVTATKYANLINVTLTYQDSNGQTREQTLNDLNQVGNLIDGDTGEELTMTKAIIRDSDNIIAAITPQHVDLVYENGLRQRLDDFPEVGFLFDENYRDLNIVGVKY